MRSLLAPARLGMMPLLGLPLGLIARAAKLAGEPGVSGRITGAAALRSKGGRHG